VPDARVGGVAVQEELGAAVVVGGAQEGVAGADAVAGRQRPTPIGGHPVGGGQPLVVPAVVVTGGDPLTGGHDLAEVGAAVGDVPEGAQGLVPELRVVGKEQRAHDRS
jgi:hypothetical protein